MLIRTLALPDWPGFSPFPEGGGDSVVLTVNVVFTRVNPTGSLYFLTPQAVVVTFLPALRRGIVKQSGGISVCAVFDVCRVAK